MPILIHKWPDKLWRLFLLFNYGLNVIPYFIFIKRSWDTCIILHFIYKILGHGFDSLLNFQYFPRILIRMSFRKLEKEDRK